MADAPTVAPQPTDAAAQPTQPQNTSAPAPAPQPQQDNTAPEPGPDQVSQAQNAPATAPARALPPSTSSGVHGVLANVALGALAGAVHGMKKVASAPGKAYGKYINSTPYGEKIQMGKLELQQKQQEMQQKQTEAMDDHQTKQLALQTITMDNLHKVAENAHIEKMYPGLEEEQRDTLMKTHEVQDAADRDLLADFERMGLHVTYKQFKNLTSSDAQKAGPGGGHVLISNGKTGEEAAAGFINNKDMESFILPEDIKVINGYEPDKDGIPQPTYRTLKAGENTALDMLISHDAGMKQLNEIQAKQTADLKTKEQAATTLSKQKEAAFGPMPKSLSDATASFTRASEAYQQNPSPENKQVLDNAKEMRQNFFSDEGEKARVEEAAKEGDPSAVSQMLVDGILAPSQLPGRFRPEFISKVLTQAKGLAQAQGKEFNPKAAEAEYSYAKSPQTQNTLNMIEAIIEPGGSLDIAKSAALNLPAMDQKTVNKVFNATATEFGSDEATRFHTAMLGLADEYAKVMGGTATDSGRQQGLDILKQDFSRGQLDAGIETILADVHARGRAIVGKNAALNAMYPNFAEKGLPQTPQTPPLGATGRAPDPKTGIVWWHDIQGKPISKYTGQ